MIRKTLCILLALTMCLSVAGCTQTPADSSSELPSVSSSSDEIKALQDQILALQSEKAEMLDTLNEKTTALADANTLLQSTQQEKDELERELDSLTEDYENYIKYVIPPESKASFAASQKRIPSEIPQYVEGSIRIDWDKEDKQYRHIWYWGCAPVLLALGEVRGCDYSKICFPDGTDLVWGYEDTLVSGETEGFKKLPEEMTILSAIRDFAITREEMEEIVEIMSDPEWRDQNKNSNFSFDYEEYELPNVDILYTFDNDIINEYYRRA